MRICLLTHSTLPRGGVVHALELGDALAERGHRVDLCAPNADGMSLFRLPRMSACRFVPVAATPVVNAGLPAFVAQRIDDWLHYFSTMPGASDYDVFHAQDAISANALATLVERGAIPGFVRTVHHLDDFDDPVLAACQTRGFTAAARVCCVSESWCRTLQRDYGIDAELISNGVDSMRYSPLAQGVRPCFKDRHNALDAFLKNEEGPVFLSVGGVEARKNTLGALAGFAHFIAQNKHFSQARWIIAGGASLLDHSAYRRRFDAAVQEAGLGNAVLLLGRVDDSLMPLLFQCADALVFPSLKEGFGLVVLEALSTATPVVVSQIAPFTEYLTDAAVEWANPYDASSISAAMTRAIEANPQRRVERRHAGLAVCSGFHWSRSAATHSALYRDLLCSRSSGSDVERKHCTPRSESEMSHA